MKTNNNSINDNNGCSTCSNGEEKYTKCVLGAFRGKEYYQYDYRHTNGELFSCLKPTLEECREKRDKWLEVQENEKEAIIVDYACELAEKALIDKYNCASEFLYNGENFKEEFQDEFLQLYENYYDEMQKLSTDLYTELYNDIIKQFRNK